VIWLASSGPEQALRRKLNPLQQEVEQLGYRCVDRSQGLSHGRILQCQLESKLNPVAIRHSAAAAVQATRSGPQVCGSTSSSRQAWDGDWVS